MSDLLLGSSRYSRLPKISFHMHTMITVLYIRVPTTRSQACPSFAPTHSPMAEPNSPVKELRALASIINECIDKIEDAMIARKQVYPTTNQLFTAQSESPRMASDVLTFSSLIVAAAGHLIAAARPTPVHALHTSMQVRIFSYFIWALLISTSVSSISVPSICHPIARS